MVRAGDITSPDSAENPGVGLADELTETYIASGAHATELVGRGWWFQYNPVQDDLTPETIFSDARLTQQIPSTDTN
ncbi:hypothetical protein DRE_04184 [Drechslerella stenobrocha 248]|uniref:Uncharacterized protein n=1 Tax=Drechslerella stenobrocha 248 TaxID=1043628 RepID=W7I2Q3_9PEZI|nr:hypothetical protein DRE_04184 [Drechslerella stenobrocha 248]